MRSCEPAPFRHDTGSTEYGFCMKQHGQTASGTPRAMTRTRATAPPPILSFQPKIDEGEQVCLRTDGGLFMCWAQSLFTVSPETISKTTGSIT